MWNLIIGIVFIIGGLSGGMVLRGTASGSALAVVGVILCIWGIVQMASGAKDRKAAERRASLRRQRRAPPRSPRGPEDA